MKGRETELCVVAVTRDGLLVREREGDVRGLLLGVSVNGVRLALFVAVDAGVGWMRPRNRADGDCRGGCVDGGGGGGGGVAGSCGWSSVSYTYSYS